MANSRTKSSNRLLVIDDDPGILEVIEDVATENGYEVLCTDNADEFRRILKSFDPTLIFVDLIIPGTDGIELLRELGETRSKAPIAMMSGMDSKVLATARRLGADHGLKILPVISKPVTVDDLEDRLHQGWHESLNVTKDALALAIKSGEVKPYYQAKVTLAADGSLPIHGAEALVRWAHPDRGLLSPVSFLAVAEKTGLIEELTDKVVYCAIEQLKRLNDKGFDISIAVNLAPQLLTDLKLPDKIVERLARFGALSKNFALEITESAAMAEGVNTLDILTRFRVKQIGLSMDDFGTGYSSLVELYRMPFSELKIDQSFVLDIDETEEARIIVRSLCDLARNLGLTTCAEGVETQSALEYLRSVGCDKAQGFLISEAVPADEFMDFVDTWDDGRRLTQIAVAS
ncbi:MAG: EAL domain-containing response regulator [Rhodospirillaceae bacterium]|jgi:EAL domain-containing protein (putative c-di-GMP-specific phosphodiesterase class I)/ActR/RegA family two-component response regulator|nr:EAL domain-containing response regulator [Rhodospirillaceae bacterium]MBT5564145.1 EAL domain-containing response regulator [Rhodospirillaceae bacterium]MBT6089940.1 EAL domain-containing response regulator [Rhodospirillaceae bacterium]MBT7451186.1 EAL domain-containing response regulator [Rhodospirillaceae bacterium]